MRGRGQPKSRRIPVRASSRDTPSLTRLTYLVCRVVIIFLPSENPSRAALNPLRERAPHLNTMGDIKIDVKLFQDRVSHLVNAWKSDARSKDGLFAGASSMIVMMGKVEETPEFHKNNAMHVSAPYSSGSTRY